MFDLSAAGLQSGVHQEALMVPLPELEGAMNCSRDQMGVVRSALPWERREVAELLYGDVVLHNRVTTPSLKLLLN